MGTANWIKKKSAGSLHPTQVETTLIQLSEAWPQTAVPLADAIQNFPLGEAALIHLFAVSSICTNRIVQNPDILLWLSQPEICRQGRDHVDMANELYRMADNDVSVNNFRVLRRWKNKEITRIALRELAHDVCLGPSSRAIIGAARARGIPMRRLGSGSLIVLGQGANQRRVRTAETDATGAILRDATQVAIGDTIAIRLHKGRLTTEVKSKREPQ